MNGNTTRREFLKESGLAAAAVAAGAASTRRAFSQGANERMGVGVIGCGGRGAEHLKRLAELKNEGENIEIVAVCDTYRPRAVQKSEKYGGKVYMDHRELLADPNVDVVTIATPDHIHGYQAIDAVHAKKHVYCEKPVTHWRQFELTKQLAEEVNKSGCTFQLGSQGMSDQAWQNMRKMIKEGKIGQPIHAECGYFRVGDWGERGMPIDDPNIKPGPDLNWEAFLGDSPKRDFDVSRYFRWRMYEDYSGGPGTDLFPHSLTPVVYMLGVTMPSSAVATGGKFRYQEREVPDTFNMLIDYPENITIAVLGTQGNDYSGTGARGAGGKIPVIRGWEATLTIIGEEIVLIPADGKKESVRFPAGEQERVKGHILDFLRCCRAGTQPRSPMDLAFYVQTALQMGILAHRAGRTAKYEPGEGKILV